MKVIRKVSILSPYCNSSNHQFFMQWFAQSCIDNGINEQKKIPIPWFVRLICAKLGMSFNIPIITSFDKALIVLGAGYIDSFAWPFAYNTEIIPILWDTWPRYWSRLVVSLKKHHVRYAFFTQSQVAKMVESEISGIKCFHLLEGVEPNSYIAGPDLCKRSKDLLELGRVYKKFNEIIVNSHIPSLKIHLFKDPKNGLLFSDFKELRYGLADSKITVCFPRCDTHPEQAGEIETMTQRYWECMLSRTLILGRAPKELIDFAGYNPVINVDWSDPGQQIEYILQHIREYQDLVDKNYHFALQHASWDDRVRSMFALLHENGYVIY